MLEQHTRELSEPRRKDHLEAYGRLYHYRALIEDLSERVDEHGEDIEMLCSQLKRHDERIEPQDDRAAEIAAARERWGIRHG